MRLRPLRPPRAPFASSPPPFARTSRLRVAFRRYRPDPGTNRRWLSPEVRKVARWPATLLGERTNSQTLHETGTCGTCTYTLTPLAPPQFRHTWHTWSVWEMFDQPLTSSAFGWRSEYTVTKRRSVFLFGEGWVS